LFHRAFVEGGKWFHPGGFLFRRKVVLDRLRVSERAALSAMARAASVEPGCDNTLDRTVPASVRAGTVNSLCRGPPVGQGKAAGKPLESPAMPAPRGARPLRNACGGEGGATIASEDEALGFSD